MSELLDKYNRLKKSQSQLDFDELNKKIDAINRLDNETIMTTIAQAMMRFYEDNYSKANGRQEKTVKEVTEQLGKMIVNAAKINKQNIADTSKSLVEAVDNAVQKIGEAIESIPQTDLSGIDASIKGIKPTDLTNLEMEISRLNNELVKLSKRKQVKQKDIDLTPIVEELSKPVNVDFEIEYDQWDYPTKIKATEVK